MTDPGQPPIVYRGRLAPTPTGYLHLGHARTFWIAWQRARERSGKLVLRVEDLDIARCKPAFAAAMAEDLQWLGINWDEGPDVGGPFGPYRQQERLNYYRSIWEQLHRTGLMYPCHRSRRDVENALQAPHDDEREPIFPVDLRPPIATGRDATEPGNTNWRFRVPDGEQISFIDGAMGSTKRTAGVEFGDFLVWRKDGFPSYELAVVADDVAMHITEVVRGADLLTSTARQLLLYRALSWQPPHFYHCGLLRDETGRRLAKRSAALSLRALREAGHAPAQVIAKANLTAAQ
jgi:glutamyl/glutaminyl-tRNA synthetase